jgi:hypothetical protein
VPFTHAPPPSLMNGFGPAHGEYVGCESFEFLPRVCVDGAGLRCGVVGANGEDVAGAAIAPINI